MRNEFATERINFRDGGINIPSKYSKGKIFLFIAIYIFVSHLMNVRMTREHQERIRGKKEALIGSPLAMDLDTKVEMKIPQGIAEAPSGMMDEGYKFPVTAVRDRMVKEMKIQDSNLRQFFPMSSEKEYEQVCQVVAGDGHEKKNGLDLLLNAVTLSKTITDIVIMNNETQGGSDKKDKAIKEGKENDKIDKGEKIKEKKIKKKKKKKEKKNQNKTHAVSQMQRRSLQADFTNNTNLDLQATANIDSITNQPRILCIVYTHEENHYKLQAVIDTWGWRCDGFIAASTQTNETIGAVKISHEGEETYENMWQKVRSIWAYIYKHYYDDFDYFWLGGDDVHLIVENLRDYLWNLTLSIGTRRYETEPLYIGHHVPQARLGESYYFVGGGPGYIFNKVTLKRAVTDVLPYCYINSEFSAEDRLMSNCLRNVGIIGNNTVDEFGKQRFHIMDSEFIASYDGKHGYFSNLYDYWGIHNGFKAHADIVSSQSVSFHFLHFPIKMKRHHAILYRSCPQDSLLGSSLLMMELASKFNVSLNVIEAHLHIAKNK